MKKSFAVSSSRSKSVGLGLLLAVGLITASAQAVKTKKKGPMPASTATVSVVTKYGIDFVETNSSSYHDKVDFAELEHDHPLSPKALQALTPDILSKLSEEELDQLYARLTAGPIPDGVMHGTVIFEKDGGLQGMARYLNREDQEVLVDKSFVVLKAFAQMMWKGKHFYKSEGVLRNLIPDSLVQDLVLKIVPRLVNHESQDLSRLRTNVVEGRKFYEVFPAKLYCGQSLLDSRRESVVIDYAYSKDLPGYQEAVDMLAARNGLDIRDEIRMIRPGFYLGRAYIQKMFGLVFTLLAPNSTQVSAAPEECWTGTQARN